MKANPKLMEKVQVNQRLITDLLEEQSLVMVEYHRFMNSYPADDSTLPAKQKVLARETLKEFRSEINSLNARILELQTEITTMIRGDVQ